MEKTELFIKVKMSGLAMSQVLTLLLHLLHYFMTDIHSTTVIDLLLFVMAQNWSWLLCWPKVVIGENTSIYQVTILE
jgi:hypothetical protein